MIGRIRDDGERRHYTPKRCCSNCEHVRYTSPTWPVSMPYCNKIRKHLGHDLRYDTKCKHYKAYITPEKLKELTLRIREITQRKYGKPR